MKLLRVAGLGLLIVGLVAYALGVLAPYPGRAFSIVAVMVGITLAAIGGGSA